MASIVDPAMVDYGKFYSAFDTVFVQIMKGLCFSADYILTNLTEACLLADIPYPAVYDENFIIALLKNLEEKDANKIILI